MDITTFNRAKQAYDMKDWESAVILFSQCGTGNGTGEACHLCGNALMRIGRVQEATQAYRASLADTSYGNQGAVYTNLGKAQMALGDLRGAIDSLRHALADQSYRGAYKAHTALGEAYSKLGDSMNAGISYRQAALDPNNPDPAKALINLGVCFMQMHRPADAAEAYRTAVDFASSEQERNLVQANLGQAYVASNRMVEAVAAFQTATAGGYQLSPAAKVDYDHAIQAVQALNSRSGAYNVGAGYNLYNNASLDPTGSSADLLPSPDSSGFFQIDESALISSGSGPYSSGGRSHTGLKIFITILIILILVSALVVGAYFLGFGFPGREGAVKSLFEAAYAQENAENIWVSSVSASARAQAMQVIEGSGDPVVVGMDASPQDAVLIVQNSLSGGATLSYRVSLVREGIGWKVTNIERVTTSLNDDTYASALEDPTTVSEDETETQETQEDEGEVEGEV